MNRLSWLLVVTSVTALGLGCQSAKFPTPKWPKMAMFKDPPSLFKKKEKELGPPSEHFDSTMDQVAAGADAKKIQTEIPGEGGAKKPSESAKPTETLAGNAKTKSNSAGKEKSIAQSDSKPSSTAGEKKPFQLTPAATPEFESPQVGESLAQGKSPIRKPYANPEADSLNKAAEKLAQDWDRKAEAKDSALGSISNNNGQSRSPLDNASADNPARAAENGLSQLTPMAPQTNGGIATTAPAGNGGGAFVFEAQPVNKNNPAVPPWNSIAKNEPANGLTRPASNQDLQPASISNVDPNQGSPNLPWSNQGAGGESVSPNPKTNLEPRNYTEIGKANPPDFQNRGIPSGGNAISDGKVNNRALTPKGPAPVNPIAKTNPPANVPSSFEGQNYPATKFPAYPSAGSRPNPNSETVQTPPAGRINNAWETQPSPVVSTDKSNGTTKNETVGLTAEIPTELLRRSGTYAPGSTRLAPTDGILRR